MAPFSSLMTTGGFPKNALVVYKKSIYEIYIVKRTRWGRKQDRRLGQDVLEDFERSHKAHYLTLKHVQDVLSEKGIRFCTADRVRQFDYEAFDFVITVGGDGTFLNAARRCRDQCLLGINSYPEMSVGRFCSANRSNFKTVLDSVIDGRAQIRRLSRAALRLNGRDTGIRALNDLLICHANPAAMSHYVIRIDRVSEHHRTSGIWISTAAGSTGAIQSAAGKPMPLESRRIQYMPRELYFRKDVRYRLKGGILKSEQGLCIQSRMEEGQVFVDGSRLCLPFGYGHTLDIALADETVTVVDYTSRLEGLHLKRNG